MAKGMVQARKKRARRASKEAFKNRFIKAYHPKTKKKKPAKYGKSRSLSDNSSKQPQI